MTRGGFVLPGGSFGAGDRSVSSGRGSNGLGRGGASGRRIAGGQWSVVHARETRRRRWRLGEENRWSKCDGATNRRQHRLGRRIRRGSSVRGRVSKPAWE